jgi:choline dehydrogenase
MLKWKIHMPAALMYNLCDDKYNWYYNTVPQKHCNNRVRLNTNLLLFE